MFNANSYKAVTVSKLAILIKDKKVLGLTGTPNELFKKVGFKLAKVHTPIKPTFLNSSFGVPVNPNTFLSLIKIASFEIVIAL